MTIDPRFNKLKSKKFIEKTENGVTYYYFEHNGVTFTSSGTDEEFKVYLDNHKVYWTNIDDISSMINFLLNTEID